MSLAATPVRPVDARLEVALATAADQTEWDQFVRARQSAGSVGRATGYHEWAWRDVFLRAFGHQSRYLMARAAGAVVGVLPLVDLKSWLFGRSLTSLPFVNYGGVVADNEDAARALVDAARSAGSRYVELRHVERQLPELPCREHKVSMWLQLEPGLWDKLDRKVRNQVRKAEKSNLTVVRGGAELLAPFYSVFARNMRDLGTPVYSKRLFAEVLRVFPDRARIVLVRHGAEPVAAGFTYRTGSHLEVPWASSVRAYNHLCPNHLLYWHAIQTAFEEGVSTFDFGRSTPNEGTYRFKAQWGAVPVALHWEYALAHGAAVPDQSPKNPKFRLAIAAWKACPLWLANAAGPRIVRWIP